MLFIDDILYYVDKKNIVTNIKNFSKKFKIKDMCDIEIKTVSVKYVEKEIDSDFNALLEPISKLYLTYSLLYNSHIEMFTEEVPVYGDILSEWADVGFLKTFKVIEFTEDTKIMESPTNSEFQNNFVEVLKSSTMYYREIYKKKPTAKKEIIKEAIVTDSNVESSLEIKMNTKKQNKVLA